MTHFVKSNHYIRTLVPPGFRPLADRGLVAYGVEDRPLGVLMRGVDHWVELVQHPLQIGVTTASGVLPPSAGSWTRDPLRRAADSA